MKKDLLIALGKHKRLIILFLLTIFLPSIFLSVFGIKAIRNERYRLTQQLEEDQIRAINLFKNQIISHVIEVENTLQNLVQSPSLINKDYETIKILVANHLNENNLLKQFFVIYEDIEPWFPPLQPVTNQPASLSTLSLNNSQQQKLKKAEEDEFIKKNYRSAISIYNDLLTNALHMNDQAQLLNRIARNLIKLKQYNQAENIYSTISNEYPDSKTSSGAPMVIYARLQLADCYLNKGEYENALYEAFDLYEKLLRNYWILTERQYRSFTSMVNETITSILQRNSTEILQKASYKSRLDTLKILHKEGIEQWEIIRELEEDVTKEFSQLFLQPKPYSKDPIRYTKTIGNKDFLMMISMIPEGNRQDIQGILGILINNRNLENDVLNNALKVTQSDKIADLIISNLSGQVIYGNKNLSKESPTVTAFFENNFPPWRIETVSSVNQMAGLIDLHKNFYFWTILLLIFILSFGVILIVRTVIHEMAVLKLKSDFVSSVSHEFKTPLTAIKTLSERLLKGKIKDQVKLKQYFSVISQDTDKLIRLVGNILDFAKIEEGKKEYDFEDTNMSLWLPETIDNYRNENLHRKIKIQSQIPPDIPHLRIDKNALAMAINNLLDNAIKASAANNEIQAIIEKKENNLLIKVKDYGIGIPPDEMDKIFDKFYQGSNASRLSTKGTGLGLTLVKHTIEAHGGKVIVDSKLQQGSTFTLLFPVMNKTEGI